MAVRQFQSYDICILLGWWTFAVSSNHFYVVNICIKCVCVYSCLYFYFVPKFLICYEHAFMCCIFKVCSATLSEMAIEQTSRFDVEKAGLLVKEFRKSFNSGKTKSYEWRMSQLQSVAKMIEENEAEIIQALADDLSKPQFESFVSEVNFIIFHSFHRNCYTTFM